MKRILLPLLTLWLGIAGVSAGVTLPALFQDGMVVQRGKAIQLWGLAEASETINITFRGKTYTVQADGAGEWRTTLPAQKAGGPYELTIGEKTITDLMIGDVWLCSGQSNMDIEVSRVAPHYGEALFDYDNPNIRLLRVRNTTDTHGPREDVPTDGWHKMSRTSAWSYSAIGYFLAREMYRRTGVAQGVIVNSWGGTPIEAWLPADTMRLYWPKMYSQTMLYQDDRLVASMREASTRLSTQWSRTLDALDPGIAGQWTNARLDESQWRHVQQDGPLTTRRDISGTLWLRQHINIDDTHAGRKALLLLGTIYDCDYTYINGVEVGRTYYEYPPRRYRIPEGLLHQGDNVITVRLINKAGVPRFYKQKPYRIEFAPDDTIALSRQWLARDGADITRQPNISLGLQNLPSTLYNAVLAPLAPYAIAGAVWYQGESNTGRSQLYHQQLKELMGSWRTLWGDSQLPFVICQLANYMQPTDTPQESGWAELREAQRLAADGDSHADLAVLLDLGETVDIHPVRKQEAAQRIANAMENLVWGKKNPISPRALTATTDEAGHITVAYDQPLQEGELYQWELQSQDGQWHNAKATAKGKNVTITGTNHPKAVRYAWKNNPDKANTKSKDGVPASSLELKIKN